MIGVPRKYIDAALARCEVDANGCWVFQGKLTKNGYARVNVRAHGETRHRTVYLHRLIYAALRGAIPDGLDIDHKCRNKACCNPHPRHLEAVTRRVNVLRGIGVSAQRARQTHCAAGHPFDEANTYVWQRRRYCRKCRVIENRARRQRRAARVESPA